ncbi:MAG TPA: dipeptidase [Candidatus Aminicenantes bacterium]|nr:dipeptidase [Candidatus Aminicenantes bacterium]HRY64654.1 dipeptidase [Candidatus Aminicenantes bacterium]HRZ71567.1 dipeptidase [Candidatus Aminicenantes bacterium]
MKPYRHLAVFGPILGLALAACAVSPAPRGVEERARALHREILTVDTHCDTAFGLLRSDWKIGERHDPALRASGKIDLPRMKDGGLDAEFFAAFVGQGPRTAEGYEKAKMSALRAVEAVRRMTEEYASTIGLAVDPAGARRLKAAGRLTAFIGLENGYPIGRDLSLVKAFYDQGVRYITLCHSSDNDICDSSTDRRDPEDKGLSEFGRQVVAECNRLGMIVDISHASDRSFYDVLAASQAPIIASHSSCRAVCDNPRNLSDDQIRALARRGGVIQICFLGAYVKTPPVIPEREKAVKEMEAKYGPLRDLKDESLRQKAMAERDAINRQYPQAQPTVRDLVDHIDHVKRIVGIDYVGIGTDFDGGGGVLGCNDVSGMIHVTEELLRRGYTDREIAKIWGGNFFRVFEKVIAQAGK